MSAKIGTAWTDLGLIDDAEVTLDDLENEQSTVHPVGDDPIRPLDWSLQISYCVEVTT